MSMSGSWRNERRAISRTAGAASRRFKIVDLVGSTIAVAGSALIAVATGLEATEKSPQAAILKSMGVSQAKSRNERQRWR